MVLFHIYVCTVIEHWQCHFEKQELSQHKMEMLCICISVPYFLFYQVTGKCGSVLVRLIPAPRGTGIVSAPVPKKLLTMAGIEDCYTSARGATSTLGNFGMFPCDVNIFSIL